MIDIDACYVYKNGISGGEDRKRSGGKECIVNICVFMEWFPNNRKSKRFFLSI